MTRTWHHVSARNAHLGRLAGDVAKLLMGKDKPMYDQAVDLGDYVVVSAARHVEVTGKKATQKVYRHHTMYPGGLKTVTFAELMRKKPDEVRRKDALRFA
jgi:large subunit ribosomal protein L13